MDDALGIAAVRLQAKVHPESSGKVVNTDFEGNVTHTFVAGNLLTTPTDDAPTPYRRPIGMMVSTMIRLMKPRLFTMPAIAPLRENAMAGPVW